MGKVDSTFFGEEVMCVTTVEGGGLVLIAWQGRKGGSVTRAGDYTSGGSVSVSRAGE